MSESARKFPSLVQQILIGMLLGSLTGYYFGTSVAILGVIGKVFIQLIKGVAVPLVFFAILDALLTTHIHGRSALRLIVIAMINATIAATIGLTLTNMVQPGTRLDFLAMHPDIKDKTLDAFATMKLNFSEIVTGYMPDNVIKPFNDSNLLAVVILALFIGLATRKVLNTEAHRTRVSSVSSGILFGLHVFQQILAWLVHLVPYAVFGVMAKTVGEYGFAPFNALLLYVLVAMGGLTLQACIVYPLWIRLVGGIPLSRFFTAAKKALIYSFGVNSSLATLPLTLETLDELGVPKSSSRLGACIGTNLNNDGILLYEAMAVLFVAQAHGIHLPLGQQIFVALLCIVAAVGVAGIPEAGVVSLSLVLTTVGMPTEILPLLLTVDWLVARGRSVVNVMSDMTVSIALGGLEQRAPSA